MLALVTRYRLRGLRKTQAPPRDAWESGLDLP
jgi:hypothetical protein